MLLGRAAGIDDEQLAHLGDDPLPPGLYDDEAAVIIRYSQASTRMLPIDDELYGALSAHFDQAQIVELCFVVGFSNLVNVRRAEVLRRKRLQKIRGLRIRRRRRKSGHEERIL